MNATREMIDVVVREMGIDAAEVGARMQFLQIGPDDAAALRDVYDLVEGHSEALADRFIAYLLSFPPLRAMLGTDGTVERLRYAQGHYIRSLLAGDYGDAYIRQRLTVGAVHQRIGLDPKWYIGAYRKLTTDLITLLWNQLLDQPERFAAACSAVFKVICFDIGLALDTYAHADQRSVRQNQNYLEQVIDGMPAGLLVIDADRRIRSMNRMMADLLGVSDEELGAGYRLEDYLPDPNLGVHVEQALQSGEPCDDILVSLHCGGDNERHLEFNIRRTQQAGGHLLLLIGQDKTFEHRARQRLQESEEFFRLTFSQAAVGIALLGPDGRLERFNARMAQILGSTESDLMYRYFRELSYDGDLPEEMAQLARLRSGEISDYQRERQLMRCDGTPVWVNLSVSLMHDATGKERFIVVAEDIERRKQAEEALLRLANHDALTGLPNRLLLEDRLSQAIMLAQRTRNQVAVMYVDLDRFKNVNDSLGHEAGDKLIVEMARRLQACLRDSDTVARQGGDEFVVVLPELASDEAAVTVAQKLLANLRQPLVLYGQEVFPAGSIGIAMYPRDGLDSATLLKSADSAMYRSKSNGGSDYSFYTAAMGVQATAHLRMEGALQRALQRREFLLHYQPVVDMATGTINGVEALLRWQPHGGAMVSPAEFIPLAEETGLIVPIGEWVLATAMAQQVEWVRQGLPLLRVGVNLSARQFLGQDVAQQVALLLEKTGCDPHYLTLEITESVLMQNPAAAADTMQRLAAMGVRLAIDDFGTGYSSLVSLKSFPINSLKIDRSFVSGLHNDADDAAIVKAVIALAHSLKLNVVAEGVETQEQLDFLREQRCDAMQGYFISRPVGPQEIERMLRTALAA